jgi:hypothetical protein
VHPNWPADGWSPVRFRSPRVTRSIPASALGALVEAPAFALAPQHPASGGEEAEARPGSTEQSLGVLHDETRRRPAGARLWKDHREFPSCNSSLASAGGSAI